MLEVTDLQVSYGQSQVIHGVSFKAQKNETVAIMGRNGMGKTTLFKSLMGILPSKASKAEVDGENVNGKSIMGLMMLAAGKGSKVKFLATGDDAQQMLTELEQLFARKFDEV